MAALSRQERGSKMLGTLFSAVVGATVWALANVVYYDMKRRGARGFGRFAAFWVGTPTTWITLFAVRKARQPSFEDHDGDAALLAEVRRDRALRDGRQAGQLAAEPEHAPPEAMPPGGQSR
jgi:hypothetical protein